jgi:tRNA-dihydrouridine synthase 1
MHRLAVPRHALRAQIRLFPELERTLAYARMLERAGCKLLAVHGRTRDQKDTTAHRADWAAIAAVRAAVRMPVLANGDVRDLREAAECMAATGTVGVLSAEPLLRNPTLFHATSAHDAADAAASRPLAWPAQLGLEYCAFAERYPTPPRMVRGHIHKILGAWLSEFTDLRDALNVGPHTLAGATAVCEAARERLAAIEASEGRRAPVVKKSERVLAREAAEAAKAAAVEEAERERAALAALPGGGEACGACVGSEGAEGAEGAPPPKRARAGEADGDAAAAAPAAAAAAEEARAAAPAAAPAAACVA